jgi:hypothetical protein
MFISQIPQAIPEDILSWYSYNLPKPVTQEQIYLLKHLYAIKEGYKQNVQEFIVQDIDYIAHTNLEEQLNLILSQISLAKYDLVFLSSQFSNQQNEQNNQNDLTTIPFNHNSTHHSCYYITRIFADKLLQILDKPFQYLTTINHDLKIFSRYGDIGSISIPLFYKGTDVEKYLSNYFNKNKIPTVNFISPFNTPSELKDCFSKMLSVDTNIQLTDKNADYTIVINSVPPNVKYNSSKCLVAQMEPELKETFWNEKYNQWYKNKSDFCFFMLHQYSMNNLEWHINKTVDQLREPIEKTKIFSTVLSSQYLTEGQKKRIDFMKYLQNHCNVDVYGRGNAHNFKNHKGQLKDWNKDEAILPYKYTFNAENCSIKNYFTEKIVDAIVGETLCFYWGCPNISDFLDPRAYIILDLNDFAKSTEIILEAVKNNEYEKRLPYIKIEKEKILNHLNIIPRAIGLINLDKTIIYVKDNGNINEFTQMANKIGLYRFKPFTDINNIYENQKNNIIVLDDSVTLVNNFIDQISFLLQQPQDKFILNLIDEEYKKESYELITTIPLNLNTCRLTDPLCYYLSIDECLKMQEYENIYENIKVDCSWKISSMKLTLDKNEE